MPLTGMPLDTKTPFDPKQRSLHSASGFGKPTHRPFREPGREQRNDAMDELRKSLESLNEATTKRPI